MEEALRGIPGVHLQGSPPFAAVVSGSSVPGLLSSLFPAGFSLGRRSEKQLAQSGTYSCSVTTCRFKIHLARVSPKRGDPKNAHEKEEAAPVPSRKRRAATADVTGAYAEAEAARAERPKRAALPEPMMQLVTEPIPQRPQKRRAEAEPDGAPAAKKTKQVFYVSTTGTRANYFKVSSAWAVQHDHGRARPAELVAASVDPVLANVPAREVAGRVLISEARKNGGDFQDYLDKGTSVMMTTDNVNAIRRKARDAEVTGGPKGSAVSRRASLQALQGYSAYWTNLDQGLTVRAVTAIMLDPFFMRALVNRINGKTLLFDASFRIAGNSKLFHLLTDGIVFAKAIMEALDEESYFKAFAAVRDYMVPYGWQLPKTIVADGDLAAIKAAIRAFPGVMVYNCIVHIKSAFRSNFKSKIKGGSDFCRRAFFADLMRLVSHGTPKSYQIFMECWREASYASDFLDYLDNNYGPGCTNQWPLRRWSLAMRPKDVPTSTNAAEGEFAYQKRTGGSHQTEAGFLRDQLGPDGNWGEGRFSTEAAARINTASNMGRPRAPPKLGFWPGWVPTAVSIAKKDAAAALGFLVEDGKMDQLTVDKMLAQIGEVLAKTGTELRAAAHAELAKKRRTKPNADTYGRKVKRQRNEERGVVAGAFKPDVVDKAEAEILLERWEKVYKAYKNEKKTKVGAGSSADDNKHVGAMHRLRLRWLAMNAWRELQLDSRARILQTLIKTDDVDVLVRRHLRLWVQQEKDQLRAVAFHSSLKTGKAAPRLKGLGARKARKPAKKGKGKKGKGKDSDSDYEP